LATTSLPIASTAASYITRARHIALKFDGDLLPLYAISAQGYDAATDHQINPPIAH
jgi:hypothetical protein